MTGSSCPVYCLFLTSTNRILPDFSEAVNGRPVADHVEQQEERRTVYLV